MKLNSLSTSNMSLMSLIGPVCLNFFRDSLAIHVVFMGRNWSFGSFFKISDISIFGQPTAALSLDLVRHQSFASIDKYMVVIVTCSPAGIRATKKYCPMSQRKFSKSLAFRAPSKGLGSGTHTFTRGKFEVNGVPYTIARFNNIISPSRDLVHSWNSSIMASTLSWRVSIHSPKAFSRVSIKSRCKQSSRKASAS